MTEQEKQPVVDIFIRTYKDDLKWLSYALASIYKFCTGFRDIIIVIPESQKNLLDGFNLTREKVFTCPVYKDDYLGQQITKLTADYYSDADFCLFTDSDTLFTTPCTPQDFTRNGKPLILKTKYEQLKDALIWKKVTEQALGFSVEFEFMRRLPFCYHLSTLKALRAYMKEKHGMDMGAYVQMQKDRRFSEFNAVGAFADKFEQDKYDFQDTDLGLPTLYVRQFWSWGGVTDSIMSEINEILKP